MSVAIIRGLLLGGLGWILWDKLGVMWVAALPLVVLFLLFWNQDSLLYVPRKGEYSQRPHQVKPLDNYEELTLVGMDGTKITAWLIKQHARGSDARSYTTSPTIVFLVRDSLSLSLSLSHTHTHTVCLSLCLSLCLSSLSILSSLAQSPSPLADHAVISLACSTGTVGRWATD